MTPTQLLSLVNTNCRNEKWRDDFAIRILNEPKLVPICISSMFELDDNTAWRAGWMLEKAVQIDSRIIVPHLSQFIDHMKNATSVGIKRSSSKICSLVLGENIELTDSQKEKMVECCFDWLLGNEKVAVKAHSMQALYYLGKDSEWIHPELIAILKREFPHESKGYQSRASKLIYRIKSQEHS